MNQATTSLRDRKRLETRVRLERAAVTLVTEQDGSAPPSIRCTSFSSRGVIHDSRWTMLARCIRDTMRAADQSLALRIFPDIG